MNRAATTIMIAVTLLCGTGAFFISRSMAQTGATAKTCNCRWLENEPEEILAFEETFNNNRKLLGQEIKTERKGLSTLICDGGATDEEIREQSERVIAAQRKMMLGVAEHLASMRKKLSPGQKDYLMRLCADTSRGPMRRQMRGGQSSVDGSQMQCGNGQGNGQGNGEGRGNGPGNGNGLMQRRRMSMSNPNTCGPKLLRFASSLQLTDEQTAAITEQNPEFELECRTNCANFKQKRSELLGLFENPASTDSEIVQAIDEVTEMHGRIESSITEYIILLRPTLTEEQKLSLSTLCSNCPNM